MRNDLRAYNPVSAPVSSVSDYFPGVSTERTLEFLGILGRGGFGTVYLANLHGRDRFVRRVAVKILRHAGDEDGGLVARQRDEARLLGLLSNEGIVQVLDLTEIGGRPAVVMEYVEGADVGEVAKVLRGRQFPFPPRAAFEIVAAAAAALDAAWSSASPVTGVPLRVIHRDIKPANIVMTARGGVKVLDFGIARAEFNRDGVTGSAFFGTPVYMAPEFWIQEPIGAAYDIFALGVSLLELLSGQPPERAPMEEVRFGVWRDEKTAFPDLPEPARALLRDLLAYNALDRPSAASAFERATDVAGGLPGDTLPRLARSLIPELVEARARTMDTNDLPSRTSLGVVSGPATGAAAAAALTTAPQPEGRFEPTLAPADLSGSRWWFWGVAGGALAVLAGALTLGLGGYVLLGSGDREGAPPAPVVVATTEPGQLAAAVPVEPAVALDAEGGAGLPSVQAPAGSKGSRSTDPVRIMPTQPPVGASSPSVAPAPIDAVPPGASPSLTPELPPTRSVAFGCSAVGASLIIDGAAAGRTPRAAVSLPDGPHTIVATSGESSCNKTIEVGANQPVGYICDLSSQTWIARL